MAYYNMEESYSGILQRCRLDRPKKQVHPEKPPESATELTTQAFTASLNPFFQAFMPYYNHYKNV